MAKRILKATSRALAIAVVCSSWLVSISAIRKQSTTPLKGIEEESLKGNADIPVVAKPTRNIDNAGFLGQHNSAQIKYYFVFGIRWSGVRYVEQILDEAFLAEGPPSLLPLSHVCFPMRLFSDSPEEEANRDLSEAALNLAKAEWYPWKYEPFSKKEFRAQLSNFVKDRCRSTRSILKGSNNSAEINLDNSPPMVSESETLDIDEIMRQTVFIMVVKDPYAWLSSVVRQKYRMAAHGNKLLKIHTTTVVESSYQELRHLMDDNRPPLDIPVKKSSEDKLKNENARDGINGQSNEGKTHLGKKRFRTLMSKRSFTLQKQYSALKKLKHSAILRYEDVLTNPEKACKSVFRGLDGVSLPKDLAFQERPNSLKQVPSLSGYGQFDIMNAPFERRDFYLEKKYLKFIDDRTMKRVNKDINKALERKVGNYITPPPEFRWQSAALRRKNKNQDSKSWLHYLFSMLMHFLTWLTVVTCVSLVGMFALARIWGSSENGNSNAAALSNPYTNSNRVRVKKRRTLYENVKAEVLELTAKINSSEATQDEWLEAFDPSSGRIYYFNTLTEESQWEHPNMENNYHESLDPHVEEGETIDFFMHSSSQHLDDEEQPSLASEFARLQKKGTRKRRGDIAQDDPVAAPSWDP